MRQLLADHYAFMAAQLVDSTVATTRAFWRAKVGYPQFSDDPRPLAECLRGEK